MKQVIVFAGTTEGRILAEWLAAEGVDTLCCVATEYGKELMKPEPGLEVRQGRLTAEEMKELFEKEERPLVLDVTHPYASAVSENIHRACEGASCRYLRLIRPSVSNGRSAAQDLKQDSERVPEQASGTAVEKEQALWINQEKNRILVDSVEEAVAWLSGTEGPVLVTTGSKELSKFTALPDFQERIFARVLATPEVVRQCTELGLTGKHLICMQGPFSMEMNLAMLHQTGARYLVTKESGRAGGFPEKLEAAERAGAKVVLIGRPPEQAGLSVEEGVRFLKEQFALERGPEFPAYETGTSKEEFPKEGTDSADVREAESAGNQAEEAQTGARRAFLIGIGMGVPENMTREAFETFRKADCILGSGRMLDSFRDWGKPLFDAYDPAKMLGFIKEHPQYGCIAVALSGDVGFYSGAKRLTAVFEAEGIETELMPGISSAAYFCSRLKMAWEDVKLMSVHGREQNLTAAVRMHFRTFTLLGGRDTVESLCDKLLKYGLPGVKLYIGERLHYPDERITEGTPEELKGQTFDGLCVALIENPDFQKEIRGCIPDEEFLRGSAPMTKSEVRGLSVEKLRLQEDSVAWDVGAGTGSVTVEMALRAFEGQVWAVEKKPEAAALIEENCRKFGTPNVHVVEGTAPEALEDLPAPTHVFIGGSSGNLKEILALVLGKNPKVRVVLNAITLETVGEANACLKELPFENVEITQIQVSKSKKVGPYQMMMGQNPVYIFSCQGKGED